MNHCNAASCPTPDPPVNREQLDLASGGDLNELRELLQLYLSQARDTVAALGPAVAAGNAAEVYRLAHRLAGSSSTCGMTALEAPLRMLEAQGRQGQLENAAPFVEQAVRELDAIVRWLRAQDLIAEG